MFATTYSDHPATSLPTIHSIFIFSLPRGSAHRTVASTTQTRDVALSHFVKTQGDSGDSRPRVSNTFFSFQLFFSVVRLRFSSLIGNSSTYSAAIGWGGAVDNRYSEDCDKTPAQIEEIEARQYSRIDRFERGIPVTQGKTCHSRGI